MLKMILTLTIMFTMVNNTFLHAETSEELISEDEFNEVLEQYNMLLKEAEEQDENPKCFNNPFPFYEEPIKVIEDVKGGKVSREFAYNVLKGINDGRRGKYDEELMFYEKAININPNNAEIYAVIATELMMRGKLQDSDNYYQRAHQLSPDDYPLDKLYVMLGYSYMLMDNSELALDFTLKALESAPEDAYSYFVLGEIYLECYSSRDIENYEQKGKENLLKAKEICQNLKDEEGVKFLEQVLDETFEQ